MRRPKAGGFADLAIRPSETYQQFLARYSSSVRLLKEQSVELPELVLGYMFLKKLKLGENTTALQAVFPEGMGGHHAKTKEIFMASRPHSRSLRTMRCRGPWRQWSISGKAAKTRMVRTSWRRFSPMPRRMADRKKATGFSGGTDASQQWRLSGCVSGRIQLLKAKTRCHHCKNWRRECPALQNKGGGRAGRPNRDGGAAGASSKDTEVHVIEENEGGGTDVYLAEHYETLKILDKFHEKVPRKVAWKEDMANDVGNSGNADTHATGNRQLVESGNTVASWTESPAVMNPAEVFEITTKAEDDGQGSEDPVPEVLSAEGLASSDPSLAECGVPDTACRRTLVAAYTLSCIERLLAGEGFRIRRASEKNDFRFGNNGTLTSDEVAIIPARVGSRTMLIRAAVLKGTGSKTPLLREQGTVTNSGCCERYPKG